MLTCSIHIMQYTPRRDEGELEGREGYLQRICRQAASLSLVPGGVRAVPIHAETIKPPLSHLDKRNKNNIRVAVFGIPYHPPPPFNVTIILLCPIPMYSCIPVVKLDASIWVLVLQQLLQFCAVLGLQCRELLCFAPKSLPNISRTLEVKLNFCLSNRLQLPVQLQKKRIHI